MSDHLGWAARASAAAAAVASPTTHAAVPDLRTVVFDLLGRPDAYVDAWHTHDGRRIIQWAVNDTGCDDETARWMWKATAHTLLSAGLPLIERETLYLTTLAVVWDAGSRGAPIATQPGQELLDAINEKEKS